MGYFQKILVVPVFLSLLGCVAIGASRKRPAIPQSVRISEGITLTAIGAVTVDVPLLADNVDFFPSGFSIEANGKKIFIDPVMMNERNTADLILITHAHEDHYSLPDIKRFLKERTTVVGPRDVSGNLRKKLPGLSVREMGPGESMIFGDIMVETVAAYNLRSGLFTPHPKPARNVGYVITIDGTKIYHAGDSDYIPEMDSLKGVTAAMVPIDGGDLTMSTEKAAEFINRLSPRYAIPMHYDIGSKEVRRFRDLVRKSIRVVILDGQ